MTQKNSTIQTHHRLIADGGEEPLLERLERLKAKKERGEPLTDEELEQLVEDIQNVEQAVASIVEGYLSVMGPAMRGARRALEDMVEAAKEVEIDEQ